MWKYHPDVLFALRNVFEAFAHFLQFGPIVPPHTQLCLGLLN
jgi:hypothetical protein